MISAVAARKAALASRSSASYSKGDESSARSSPIFDTPDQTSKRKPSQNVGSKHKKARKSKNFDRPHWHTGKRVPKEQRHIFAIVTDEENDSEEKGDLSTSVADGVGVMAESGSFLS